eukprot:jgi/Chrzof1/8128/UNPLg00173.t1
MESQGSANPLDNICDLVQDMSQLKSLKSLPGQLTLSAAGVHHLIKGDLPCIDNNTVSWVVEKVTSVNKPLLTSAGVADGKLIGLFQQLYGILGVDGTILDSPVARLAAAGAVAIGVKALLSFQGSNKDCEESAAERLAQRQAKKSAVAAASIIKSVLPANEGSSQQLPPAAAVAQSVGTAFVVGMVKKHTKLQHKATAVINEICQGKFSPTALLVAIEIASVMHSYGEIATNLTHLVQY